MLTPLLVPIKIDAWVVNAGVNSPPGTSANSTGRTIRQWKNNYSNLTTFTTTEATPLQSEKSSANKGIYIKWELPKGLCHVIHSDEDKEVSAFPAVPTRWLIARTWIDSNGISQVNAWIVESNYLQGSNSGSVFPNPAYLQDPNANPQILLGRALPLAEWKENSLNDASAYLKELTAVANGDLNFSSFQPYNSNVFSYYDDLHDVVDDPENPAVISYFVSGWYADLATDPVWQLQLQLQKDSNAALANWLTTLNQSYFWQPNGITSDNIESQASLVNQIKYTICHGLSCNIPWNTQGVAPASSVFDTSKVKYAIGNSTAEALAALMTNPQNNKFLASLEPQTRIAFEQLLAIFQKGQLSQCNSADGLEEAESLLHASSFNKVAGGLLWKIVPSTSANKIINTIPALSAEIMQQLDALNSLQTIGNEQSEALKSLQWQLYALWWRFGNNYSLDFPDQNLQEFLAAQLSVTSQQPNLYTNTLALKKAIDVNIQTIEEKKKLLKDALRKHSGALYVLKTYPEEPFYEPVDPVILITNVQAPMLTDTPDILATRLDTQILTSLVYVNANNQPVDLNTPSSPLTLNNLSALPPDVSLLWQEFLLLDEAIRKSGSQVSINPLNNVQIVPALTLASWQQPWSPLFLEWAIDWYPFNMNDWQFDGDTNTYQTAKNHTNISAPCQSLSGRTLITSQGRADLIGQLSHLSVSELQQLNVIDSKAFLTSFISQVQSWDILSQRLEGFHLQLAQRDIQMHRAPSITSQVNQFASSVDGTEQDYAKAIEGEAFHPPALTFGSFQPLRQGWFMFTQLSIVDHFGQCINIITPQNIPTPDAFSISVPLQPLANVTLNNTTSALGMTQLPPRVTQPMRLRLDWLSAQDDSHCLRFDSTANPVCGWLLPNYFDQGFQVYAPTGNLLGELILSDTKLEWTTVLNSPYTSLQELTQPTKGQPPYVHLGNMLLGLQQGQLTAYRELMEVITKAIEFKSASHTPTTDYLTNLIGQPLALVRTGWQFEYAGLPYQDQLNLQTLTEVLQQYPFSSTAYPTETCAVRLGNLALLDDGLIGFFKGTDYHSFNSVYLADSSQYVSEITGNELMLPLKPTQSAVTLLLNPRMPFHAYTDTLPAFETKLPAQFAELLSKNLAFTLQLGPLITNPFRRSDADVSPLSDDFVNLPKPLLGGTWSWLQYRDVSLDLPSPSWQSYAIKSSDATARFTSEPNELNEGWLQLSTSNDIDKRKSFYKKITPIIPSTKSSAITKQVIPGTNINYSITQTLFTASPSSYGMGPAMVNTGQFSLIIGTNENTLNLQKLNICIPCIYSNISSSSFMPLIIANEGYNLTDDTEMSCNIIGSGWNPPSSKLENNPNSLNSVYKQVSITPIATSEGNSLQVDFDKIIINQSTGNPNLVLIITSGNIKIPTIYVPLIKYIPDRPSFIKQPQTINNVNIINSGDPLTLSWQILTVNNMSVSLSWTTSSQEVNVTSIVNNQTSPVIFTNSNLLNLNVDKDIWTYDIPSLWAIINSDTYSNPRFIYNFTITLKYIDSSGNVQYINSDILSIQVNKPLIFNFKPVKNSIYLKEAATLNWNSQQATASQYALQIGRDTINTKILFKSTNFYVDSSPLHSTTYTLIPYGNNAQIMGRIPTEVEVWCPPNTPCRLPEIPGGGWVWEDAPPVGAILAIEKYICFTNNNGISIIDITQPTAAPYNMEFDANCYCALASIRNLVFVANSIDEKLQVIDIKNLPFEAKSIQVEGCPCALATSENYVFTANIRNNTVSVIDSNKLSSLPIIIPVGKAPVALIVSKQYVFVANYGGKTVSVINTTNFSVPPITISTGGYFGSPSFNCALLAAGDYVFVSDINQNKVSVISTNNLESTLPAISVGKNPRSLAAIEHFIFVANTGENTLSIIDTTQLSSSVRTIKVGNCPASLASAGNFLYVANYSDQTISVIDFTHPTAPIISTLSLNIAPFQITVSQSKQGQNIISILGRSGAYGIFPYSVIIPEPFSENVFLQANLASSALTKHCFNFYDKSANSIHLAGSFNNWLNADNGRIAIENPVWQMKKLQNGIWTLTATLPTGRHEFKYVINKGERWENDPNSQYTQTHDYYHNSALELTAPTNAPSNVTDKIPPHNSSLVPTLSYQALDKLVSHWEQLDLEIAIKRSLSEVNLTVKQDLAQQAAAYGFDCQDVIPDGNCFFHSVAHQLAHLSLPGGLTGLDAETIREKALHHILEHLEYYAAFFDEEKHHFIDKLLRQNEWADQIFIQATAKALNLTLVIIASDATHQPLIINKGATQATLFLGHEMVVIANQVCGLHYQSLTRNPHRVPIKSIEEVIKHADEDQFETTMISTTETNQIVRSLKDPIGDRPENLKPPFTLLSSLRALHYPPRQTEFKLRNTTAQGENNITEQPNTASYTQTYRSQ